MVEPNAFFRMGLDYSCYFKLDSAYWPSSMMDSVLNFDKRNLFLGLGLLLIVTFSFMPILELLIPPVVVSSDSINETADGIISKSRKGSIRAEFPSEFYDKTLEDI